MKNRIRYWYCQLGGWGTYCVIYTFFYLTIRTKVQPYFFEILICDAVIGISVTHLMRFVIARLKLLSFAIQKQIIFFFVVTVLFSFVYAFTSVVIEDSLNFQMEQMKGYSLTNKTIRASFGSFLFLLIWNLIYFTYHYVQKGRQEQLDRIRLESLVKELELKTIKSHINPHFIFNALNSIRALVDENPERARTAITELSNILRSSMLAEKIEMSSLEKELGIVKDYLALESIRFESRLQIEYDIDEDTLDQPVPPMMLQTLVENAIKHGVSKQVSGGIIRIISDFNDNHHELIVQNSGQLNGEVNADGFGISSTYNRLNLLFGKKAQFELKNIDGYVEAKVIMPIHNL